MEVVILNDKGEVVRYRDVPGFPGYRVGDDGSVWSCRVKGPSRPIDGPLQWHRLQLQRRRAKGSMTRYTVVHLRAEPGGKLIRFYVHRLVLDAFVGPCPDGLESCHEDGDTANNVISNLRWDTHAANIADKVRHGTVLCGERHPSSRLTEAAVRRVHQLRREGLLHREIAVRVGISDGYVGTILCGKRWRRIKEAVERESVTALLALRERGRLS